MNLKFPLLNLISRGHLPLANKVSTFNFAKQLDDGPANKICYEMLKFDNLKDSAMFLEHMEKTFYDEFRSVPYSINKEADFRYKRDAILIRESNDQSQQPETQNVDYGRQFINFLRAGGWVTALGWYASRSQEQKNEINRTLKRIYPNVYKQLQDNWVGRFLHLPADNGDYFKRLAKTAIGKKNSSSRNWLNADEKDKIVNFFKKSRKTAGIAALIASSVAVALVSISLIYKRYFSKEAKICNSLSGKERTICMTKARIKAAEVAMAEAEKGLLECSSAKNEEDCIFKMKVEIRSWRKKKMIEEEKLRKLINVNKDAFDEKPNDPFS